MAFEYQNYASLGVNLNRQKYGPLDISSVFNSTADLIYYITKGATKLEGLSSYWEGVVPYPYEGQIVSLVENGEVEVFKLVLNNDNVFETVSITNDIELPDNLATKDYVAEEIEKIEIPTLPENVATKDYVAEEISKIEIPEITLPENIATKQDITSAISDLVDTAPETLDTLGEIATALKNNDKIVDTLNEAIGKKADKTDLENLVDTDYVDQAISKINFPKADINVYEFSTETANPTPDDFIDELEGITINKGDVMIITQIIKDEIGVKSAYQFDDGWIACDGNVDASKVIMPYDITLAGQYDRVCNLTKSKTGTTPFYTKGKPVATVLQEILSKREQPSKTNPKVSLTVTFLDNDGKSVGSSCEVGTEVTPTWNASLSAGSYTYGPSTGITAKTWVITESTHTNEPANTATGSFQKITVKENTSYSITATATHDSGPIALDNLGGESNPKVQIAAASPMQTAGSISGYRSWFTYVGSSIPEEINSDFIRAQATNKGNYKDIASTTLTIPAGTKLVIIAIPKDGKVIDKVTDIDGMGLDNAQNYYDCLTTMPIKGYNNYTAKEYNVWAYTIPEGLKATRHLFEFKTQ